MFGYVITNQDDLKVKEVKKYRAYYCGLCHSLKENHGIKGQATLTYDMTFMCILLSALYDTETKQNYERCIMHPLSKHQMLCNEITDYASDMNLLMAYYNLKDDWTDDHNLFGKISSDLLKKECQKIAKKYPRQNQAITSYIEALSACEKKNEPNPDIAAGLTGRFLGEIFAYKQDEWYDDLWQLGFYLGKFIYLCDAYEDMEEDEKKKHYNPFLASNQTQEEIEEISRNYLLMMASEVAKYFERLPIIEDVELLRNIIYSGIWSKYEQIHTKRIKEKTDTRSNE